MPREARSGIGRRSVALLAAGSRLGIGDSSEFKGVGNHGLNQDAFLLERSGSVFSANVRDDLLGTAGTPGAAKPSTQSDSGGELGRSLCSDLFVFNFSEDFFPFKNPPKATVV